MVEQKESHKIVIIGTSDRIPNLFQQEEEHSSDKLIIHTSGKITAVSTEVEYLEESHILCYTYGNTTQEEVEETKADLYDNAAAAILVYDYMDPDSVHHVKKWMKELRQRISPPLPTIMLGIKSGDEYLSEQLVRETAADLKLKFYVTSIPNPKLVEELNHILIKKLLMPSDGNQYLLKVCIVGSHTTHNQKFGNLTADSEFNHMATLGVDMPTKFLRVNKELTKLIMVVMGGDLRKRGENLRSSFYRGAIGVIILYDKSDPTSFEDVNQWQQEAITRIKAPSLFMALVGIKTGDELITTEAGEIKAKKLQCTHYETSLQDKRQVGYILKEMATKGNEFFKKQRELKTA